MQLQIITILIYNITEGDFVVKINQNVLDAHINISKWETKTFVGSIDLFEGSKEIHIEHGYDKYTLKINDQDELELLLNTN